MNINLSSDYISFLNIAIRSHGHQSSCLGTPALIYD